MGAPINPNQFRRKNTWCILYQYISTPLALNSTTEIMLLPTYMPKKLYLIRVRLDRPNTYETLDTNQDFFETSASNGKLKPIVLRSDYHINSYLTFLSISFLFRFEQTSERLSCMVSNKQEHYAVCRCMHYRLTLFLPRMG